MSDLKMAQSCASVLQAFSLADVNSFDDKLGKVSM